MPKVGRDWIEFVLEGMRGDPEAVNPALVRVWSLTDLEVSLGRARPRREDAWSPLEPADAPFAEQVYGVYTIPHPIAFPLVQAWLTQESQSLIGSKGLFYVAHQTAGYFFLNRNLLMVVRFMGFLKDPLTANAVDIVIEARDPSEFYDWMQRGFLQLSALQSDGSYQTEIVEYSEAELTEERWFRAKLKTRGARGTVAKAFPAGTALFSVFLAAYQPAPEIQGVENRQTGYATLREGYTSSPDNDLNFDQGTDLETVSDLNTLFDKPVFVAPVIGAPWDDRNRFPFPLSEENYLGAYLMFGIQRYTDLFANGGYEDPNSPHPIGWAYSYPPRPAHSSYRNQLANNWDVYDTERYAYWRSLWEYKTVTSYSEWQDGGGRWLIYWYANDGFTPQVEMTTFRASKIGLGIYWMIPVFAGYHHVLYRFLKNPFGSTADESNYAKLDWSGIRVITFPWVRVFGVPLELQNDPKAILGFELLKGSVPSRLLTAIPPAGSEEPVSYKDYAPTIVNKAFLGHQLPVGVPLDWSYDTVRFRTVYKLIGDVSGNGGRIPFLMAEFRNVTVRIPEGSQEVWGFLFKPFVVGTTNEEGSPYIAHTRSRAWSHPEVVTHVGLQLLWDIRSEEQPRGYWFFRHRIARQGTNEMMRRAVLVCSPFYHGSVEGRTRAYSAILWSGPVASRAASVKVFQFTSAFNTPVVQVLLPNGAKAGDQLVLYEMTAEPKAVGVLTFDTDQSPNTVVEVADQGALFDYPFVWATEPIPYGPAVSHEGRLLVLDGSVWCSALSDYPQFTAYPRQEGDGYRVLVADPVDRIVVLENQAVLLGPRALYRVVLGKIEGYLVPYPVGYTSDIPFARFPHLQDHESFVTRKGLYYKGRLVYALREDWLESPSLQEAWLVQSPYGPCFVRRYADSTKNECWCLVPFAHAEGYTRYQVVLPIGAGLRAVRWEDGLVLYLDTGRDRAVRVAGGSEQVERGVLETGVVRIPQGLRPRMMEVYGACSATAPIVAVFYERGVPDIEAGRILESDPIWFVTPNEPMPMPLRNHQTALGQLQVRFEVGRGALFDSAAVRISSTLQP